MTIHKGLSAERSIRTQRAMNFAESELLFLVEQYGATDAFGCDWTSSVITNLFNAGGTEDDVNEVFGRVRFELTERVVPAGVIAFAMHCLECRLTEVKASTTRAYREGVRPTLAEQFSRAGSYL